MNRRAMRRMPFPPDMGDMLSPVRCRHCHGVYDLAKVEIVGRHLDCSIWHCPGCNLQIDDRGESGSSMWGRKQYDRIEKVTGGLDVYGNPIDWDL